jgi:hypothetical protein
MNFRSLANEQSAGHYEPFHIQVPGNSHFGEVKLLADSSSPKFNVI